MTRAERVCRSLPSWMLRAIVRNPFRHSWWAAAWLELWKRDIDDLIALYAADEPDAWPCVFVSGVH